MIQITVNGDSDTTLDGSELAAAIDQANLATGNTSTVFTITAAERCSLMKGWEHRLRTK